MKMETTDFHRYVRSNRVESFQYKFDISFLSYKLNAESNPTPTNSRFLNTPVSLVLYNLVWNPYSLSITFPGAVEVVARH
jgi:hypothetical protein